MALRHRRTGHPASLTRLSPVVALGGCAARNAQRARCELIAFKAQLAADAAPASL